jgi:hypothetical protein
VSIGFAVEKLRFSANYASVFALPGSPVGEFSNEKDGEEEKKISDF